MPVPVSQGAATSREGERISNQNIMVYLVYPVFSRDSSVLTRDLWVLTSCVACICEGVYFWILFCSPDSDSYVVLTSNDNELAVRAFRCSFRCRVLVLVLGAVGWLCAWWKQGAGAGRRCSGCWLCAWREGGGCWVVGAGARCWVPVLGAGAGCRELACRCSVLVPASDSEG